MSSCVCKILFKSEQICGCCFKMLRGLLFLGHGIILLYYVVIINVMVNLLLFQNQFFITIDNDSVVQNKIASALYDRIVQAHQYVRLWNQLPASLCQPHTNLFNSDSLNPLSSTSSIGSIDSPLSSSITPHSFHSRLKTFLFCKSFPL